jgi:hypothetical protein
MMDDFQNTGGSGGDVGHGADVPSSSGGTETRQDRVDARHADQASTRAVERQQDGGPQAKPSGYSVREQLQASWKASLKTPEGQNITDEAFQAELPAQPANPEGRRRGAGGRFVASTPTVGDRLKEAVTTSGDEQQPPAQRPAAPAAPQIPAVPYGYDEAAKAAWASNNPEVVALRNAAVKREEYLNSQAEAVNRRVRDFDTVYHKHPVLSQALANQGLSEAEFMDQALGIFGGLKQGNIQNPADKARRIQTVAGIIQMAELTPQEVASIRAPTPQQVQENNLRHQVQQLVADREAEKRAKHEAEQKAVQEAAARAEKHYDTWRVGKAHIERDDVRHLMWDLMQRNPGEYSMPNGLADLDKAHRRALAALELRTPQEDARAHRAEHAANARAAGVSVGTRAPTGPPGPRPSNRRDLSKPTPSVRDRLLEALREHSA